MDKHRLMVFFRSGLWLLFLSTLHMMNPLPVLAAVADPGKIAGRVLDEKGEPLIGASVKIEGTTTGAVSGADGSYTLSVQPGTYTVVITYISYKTQRIPRITVTSGQTTPLNINMQGESGTLNEVVVVGYGTQKKENLTGAVDQVSADVLENRPLPNVSQGLQGALPNLNITPQDGKPTQSPRFNIRGTTSVGQGGSALVLIDGVEGDPSRLNPNDI
ncbi:MAG: carboxypeptidase-like regulatory domain-containing protein, partial [Mucilaginibacter polytrichastri]|nr:carboxypeptidase-like regulatory domain-containing protein [Mucilaginibacter polytrichastri]